MTLMNGVRLEMKHLVLDTGIFRKAPRLDSAEFKTLSYLARKKYVRLHIPYMVEMEFSTHLEQEQKARIAETLKSLKGAIYHAPLGKKTVELPGIIESLEQSLDEIVAERSAAFISWTEENHAQRHGLSLEEAQGALEAYANGYPPLKAPKVRKDIPDSFIFQNIQGLKSQYKEDLCVVIEDGALAAACKNAGVEVFSSLPDFLASEVAKKCLAEKVIDENLAQVLEKVKQVAFESETGLVGAIESLLLSDEYRLLYGDELPGESNEIFISLVSAPHEINLGEFEHIGAGVFVCPFIAKVELTYEYEVYISESFNLESEKFYIEPLNDHYVNVETSDEFEFSGRVELDFGEDILNCATVENLLESLESPELSVDDLKNFHLADE